MPTIREMLVLKVNLCPEGSYTYRYQCLAFFVCDYMKMLIQCMFYIFTGTSKLRDLKSYTKLFCHVIIAIFRKINQKKSTFAGGYTIIVNCDLVYFRRPCTAAMFNLAFNAVFI